MNNRNGNIININEPQINFENCKFVMLDTCSIIQLALDNEESVNFATEAAENNVTLCYSLKTLEELQILSESQNIPKDKRQANLNMNFFINKSQEQAERILNKIHKLPNMYNEPIGTLNYEVYSKARENQKEFNLRWGDAVIYTMAKNSDIDGIMTFDGDFRNVRNNITIFKGNKKKK
ncbi:type II toxin-antitoxin system VapC family toxin [Clostridium perfringens]